MEVLGEDILGRVIRAGVKMKGKLRDDTKIRGNGRDRGGEWSAGRVGSKNVHEREIGFCPNTKIDNFRKYY